MNSSIFIWLIYISWIVVVIYLTVAASGVKRDVRPHLGQSFTLLFLIIAGFLLPYVPIFHFLNYAPVNPVLTVIGIILFIVGIAVLVSGRQHLGRNWSQTVAAKENPELITSGPYSLVRHPMYAGGLLATVGSAIVCGGAFVFLLVLLGALFLWRVGAEDKLMAQRFPEVYPVYMKGTKALIPFIW